MQIVNRLSRNKLCKKYSLRFFLSLPFTFNIQVSSRGSYECWTCMELCHGAEIACKHWAKKKIPHVAKTNQGNAACKGTSKTKRVWSLWSSYEAGSAGKLFLGINLSTEVSKLAATARFPAGWFKLNGQLIFHLFKGKNYRGIQSFEQDLCLQITL